MVAGKTRFVYLRAGSCKPAEGYCTLAVTEAAPFRVKVHVFVLLPPLEHAPDQMTSRPFVALSVIEVPTANDDEPLLPVVTLMPAGLELTRSPPRPVAVTLSVAVWPPPPPCAAGVTVSVALRVVPLYVAEMVTVVDTETVLVERLKPQMVAPAPTVTLAGTVATEGLLLDSATCAPPCGAPALSVTVPPPLLPPVTLEGLNDRLCSVGGGGGP